MNIFVLHEDPTIAATMYCDKHVPKMVVELYQQLGSAVIRHGATPDVMPLTKKGTPLKGGYHNHPATRWVGESKDNYHWTMLHALSLCDEYTRRFGKVHFCEAGINQLCDPFFSEMIEDGPQTPFALCMPDEYTFELAFASHASGDDAVQAYRRYYHSKEFAQWNKGTPAPEWWMGAIA